MEKAALAIIQRKVYTPAMETVTLEVGELALAKLAVPGPLNRVQVPVPVTGVLPARLVVRPQGLAFRPAFAAVGGALATMLISSSLAVQGALAIVHLNT